MRITTNQVRELLEQDKSGRITRELLQAFLLNPQNWTGGIVELEYCEDIVVRHGDEGGPWGYRDKNINDDNYPVKGEGIVKVKFQFFFGCQLERDDGWVYRSDVEAYFRDRGMCFPNAAEALLPPAKDKQLGRGDHPYVAFVSGSDDAFVVSGNDRVRDLSLSRDVGLESHNPCCVFVGVCE